MYFDSRNVHIVDGKQEAAAAILFVHWSCTRRWFIDKLWILHANQTSVCLDPRYNLGEVGAVSALVNFFLTVPGRCFFVDLICYLSLSYCHVCFL